MQLLLFTLDDRRYALTLSSVDRVIFMVDITPLPKAPASVLGVVNVAGAIVPVYDLRKRFGLPERETNISDNLIITTTSKQKAALVADNVRDVLEVPEEKLITAEKIFPEMEYVKGVVKLQDGLVLIHDLEKFLSSEEERLLDGALAVFDELMMRHA
jgi:purine-binding chemotaxis protein CheW